MSATIKDIARATGLSLSTISKYINGGSVRQSNRIAIEQAIKEFDFHPNEAAQAIRCKTRRTIVVIIPNINVDYCRSLVLYCQNRLREENYAVVFYDCNNDAVFEEKLIRKAVSNRADGIIAIPMNVENPGYAYAREEGVPVVFLCPYAETKADYVVSDDIKASTELIRRLGENGHRRVGVIVGRTEYRAMMGLLEVERRILEEYVGEITDDLIYPDPSLSLDVGYNGAKTLLSIKDPPTALICLNGELLLGAKIAILEMGLRIPEDISLCGFALESLAASPVLEQITLVRYPMDRMSEEAVRVVLERINEKREAEDSGKKWIPGSSVTEVDAEACFRSSIKLLG